MLNKAIKRKKQNTGKSDKNYERNFKNTGSKCQKLWKKQIKPRKSDKTSTKGTKTLGAGETIKMLKKTKKDC